MQKIGKFDVKIDVIPNGLGKSIAFIINKNLFLIKISLDSLVKSLTDDNFKYLSQEFNGEQLNLAKWKGVSPYEYMNSFEKFSEDKLPDRREFYSSLKDGCISEKDLHICETDGCISEKDGHINEEDYLHDVIVWNEFKMISLVDYHDLYLKTRFVVIDWCIWKAH